MARRPAWSRTLSPREREVVRWLTAGLSRREIARRLHVSDETVKTHLTNAYRKLGVRDRFEAAALIAPSDAATPVWSAGAAPRRGRRSGPTKRPARHGTNG